MCSVLGFVSECACVYVHVCVYGHECPSVSMYVYVFLYIYVSMCYVYYICEFVLYVYVMCGVRCSTAERGPRGGRRGLSHLTEFRCGADNGCPPRDPQPGHLPTARDRDHECSKKHARDALIFIFLLFFIPTFFYCLIFIWGSTFICSSFSSIFHYSTLSSSTYKYFSCNLPLHYLSIPPSLLFTQTHLLFSYLRFIFYFFHIFVFFFLYLCFIFCIFDFRSVCASVYLYLLSIADCLPLSECRPRNTSFDRLYLCIIRVNIFCIRSFLFWCMPRNISAALLSFARLLMFVFHDLALKYLCSRVQKQLSFLLATKEECNFIFILILFFNLDSIF